MSKLLKALLATTVVLTLMPTAAPAAPQQCYEVCDPTSCCDDVCAYRQGTGYVFTTCGGWGMCGGTCAADASKQPESMSTGEDRQAVTSQSCGGEPQTSEQAATEES